MAKAFEQLPPNRLPKLLKPADLGRIPVGRWRGERTYWEGVEQGADLLRLMMADTMLNDILIHPDGTTVTTEPVKIGNIRGVVSVTSDISGYVLEGLGLSQFVQRAGVLNPNDEEGGPEFGARAADTESVFDIHVSEGVARLHMAPRVLKGLMPAFDPDRPAAWYGDGLSVVHVTQPAEISEPTRDDFTRQSGGEQLDGSRLAMIVPYLTHAYLRPPFEPGQ